MEGREMANTTANSSGLITNAQEVQAVQLHVQKQLRRIENQDFNANAIKHTNPAIPDASKAVRKMTQVSTRPGKLQLMTNQNIVRHTNPAIKDPGSVISINTQKLKGNLGSKVGTKMDKKV